MNYYRVFLLYVIGIMLTSATAFASDLVWQTLLMNNHDVLAIGEIVALSEGSCTIEVDSTIVSAKGDRPQLKPDIMVMTFEEEGFDSNLHYVGNRSARRQVGDFVLAAANKIEDDYSGVMYKIDNLDKASLTIDVHADVSSAFLMDVAIIEDFIHSDGQNTEFGIRTSADGTIQQVWRYADKNHDIGHAEIIYEVYN